MKNKDVMEKAYTEATDNMVTLGLNRDLMETVITNIMANELKTHHPEIQPDEIAEYVKTKTDETDKAIDELLKYAKMRRIGK